MNNPLFSVALGALLFTSFEFSASGTESGISTRIINGTPADAGNFPFMVALHYSTLQSSFCGGSYLGDKYVLTAAHCVTGKNPLNAEDIEVTVGAYDLRTNAGRRVKVKQIYYHEAYDDETHADYNERFNDIAILELETSLPIQAVTRPNTGALDALGAGTVLETIGFGTTSYNQLLNKSSNPSQVLRKAEISLMDTATCQALGGSNYPRIRNDAFCATSYPQDTCQGDSGGPVFINDGGNFIQYGVVSWGRGCGLQDAAGVYAKVDHFNNWLTQRTSKVSFRQSQHKNEIKYGLHTHRFNFVNGSDEVITANNVTLSPASANITAENCSQGLAPSSQCYVDVSYAIDSMTPADVRLEIDTNSPLNLGTVTSSLKLNTVLQPAAKSLEGLITIPNSSISVNVNPWLEEGGWLRSAVMNDKARSVLFLENVPRGKVNFDFQVSSTFLYDSLIVKVNGSTYIIEDGERSGNRTLYLNDEVNDIRFEYVKTSNTATGNDAAYIKNLKYEKPYSFTLPPVSGGSGGGSTGGMTLLSMLAALLIRRRYMSH
ncbi:serine protease [Vibrio ordalii]|uniref:S1 family peptidase n=1 Tax=Vibrio ordalii TaxID=28174 RepID=UPI002574EA52|nr:serine protease [Vibrio ordalii]MCS0350248.1 serine protease [Vibrio ordalii]